MTFANDDDINVNAGTAGEKVVYVHVHVNVDKETNEVCTNTPAASERRRRAVSVVSKDTILKIIKER